MHEQYRAGSHPGCLSLWAMDAASGTCMSRNPRSFASSRSYSRYSRDSSSKSPCFLGNVRDLTCTSHLPIVCFAQICEVPINPHSRSLRAARNGQSSITRLWIAKRTAKDQ